MIPEDNREFFADERPELSAGARCAVHPARAAAALCEECGRPVCAECAPLQGGGRAFCRECLASSRLVDSEPAVLGGLAADAPGAAARGRSREGLYLILAVILLVVFAAMVAWELLPLAK